jgi:response regulator RpfG family c-di-GMP phosphodiesterase
MGIFDKKKLVRLETQERSHPRHTVMIVDDEDSNRALMAAVLGPHFNLIEATDGQHALEIIEHLADPQSLSCIVSDHRMPRMTGAELFERIRSMLPHTVRIMVTGYISRETLNESIARDEISNFILKPYEAQDFLHTVIEAVETS